MIYFIVAPEIKLMKIGFTELPVSRRLAGLQTASPILLEFAGAMPGDRALEAQLHARFAALKSRGEWFRIDDELLAFVAALPKYEEPKAERIIVESVQKEPQASRLQQIRERARALIFNEDWERMATERLEQILASGRRNPDPKKGVVELAYQELVDESNDPEFREYFQNGLDFLACPDWNQK